MEISRKAWRDYITKLQRINVKAANLMEDWIANNGYDDIEAMIYWANGLTNKYGNAAAALACEMYDAIAEAQGVIVPPAYPADVMPEEYVAAAVRKTLDTAPTTVQNVVGRIVKQAGADTVLQNAKRDGAQFAWIPNGDTCAFCITLASRGWQNMSKNAMKNGHAEHIHSNCDCQYGVRFDGKSNVAGYDPEEYREMYYSAGTGNTKDKINALRRELYNLPKKQMLRLARSGNIFVGKLDVLGQYAKKIHPLDGYVDIVVHGDPYSLVFKDTTGKETNVSAKDFCDIIEKAGIYNGGKIRLIACQTGAKNGIVPTYIAKRFNTEVLAPTEIVNVDFNGNMVLANDEVDAIMGIETGEWVRFNKDGRIK